MHTMLMLVFVIVPVEWLVAIYASVTVLKAAVKDSLLMEGVDAWPSGFVGAWVG